MSYQTKVLNSELLVLFAESAPSGVPPPATSQLGLLALAAIDLVTGLRL
jgi:hypothetical protein